MTKKPNIIIFNPDQMRTDSMHHMGNPAAITPNLDAFAENDAVSYRHAYCQNPLCTPSRCSFLTGLYPHVYGHRIISYALHGESTILSELKESGYHVWMNGRNDFLPAQEEGVFEKHADVTYFGGGEHPNPPVNPDHRGRPGNPAYYSHYVGELRIDENGINYSRDDDSVDEAIRTIRNRPEDKPLCIFLGLMYPHPPYEVEEPYFSAIDRSKLPPRIQPPEDWSGFPSMLRELNKRFGMSGWDEEQFNELRACYLGMVMKVDAQFGKLVNTLKQEGIYDDTAIFFFSDHGDFTGDYGVTEKCPSVLTENLLNVPLLIKPPKGFAVDPGISDGFAELIDFYATAAEFSGITPDHTHFGRSLCGNIADRSHETRRYVFSETGRLRGETHCTAANDVGGVAEENIYYPKISLQASENMEAMKATMIRSKKYKFIRRLYEDDEFYDMENDPAQLHNLIHEQEYSTEIAAMRENMLTWYQETCDVVPFKRDSRIPEHVALERIKRLGEEQYRKAIELLDSGMLPQAVMVKFGEMP